MNISIAQFCPLHLGKEKNIAKIDGIIADTESDLIVFPELCTTGYYFSGRGQLEQYAENRHGETVTHFQGIAGNSGKALVIGFAEQDGDRLFNSAAILFPESQYSSVYRKTHLFYRERFYFDEGDTGFFVIDYEPLGLRLGTMICYDWRFPEAARTLGLKGADLIVCPSNLITDVWHLAMPARAIENKVYFAVANRIGTEDAEGELLLFKGMSVIYGFNGSALAIAGASEDVVLTAEIEPSATRDKSFNPYNDIFGDRRPGLYFV